MSTEISIELQDGVLSGKQSKPTGPSSPQGRPLIVALHGGSYSSAFFDIPGYSLLDRAAAAGCCAVGLDRPGYRASTLLSGNAILDANAERLEAGIAELWQRAGNQVRGVVLVGHSIGAAVTILIAARGVEWPLLGIAVSGIGLSLPPGGPAFEPESVSTERLEVPSDIKNARMFGPPGTYPDDAPQKAAAANEPVVWREIVEINTQWAPRAQDSCARVRVPVHYRQGEHDSVFAQGAEQIEKFRRAFSNAPGVDARMIEGAGHCIDFHHAGRTFQEDQIAFAIACAR
jgi:pimeloyl-ACP methyl ester carboxylesterase